MVGKPLVYATSRQFMDYFGINSPDELPKISEVLAEQMVMPTLVNAEHFEVEGDSQGVGMGDEGQGNSQGQRTGDKGQGDEGNAENFEEA